MDDIAAMNTTRTPWGRSSHHSRSHWIPSGLTALGAAALLVACGGGDSDVAVQTDTSGARGSLVYNPPQRVVSLGATQFTERLSETSSGQSLLSVAGTPRCGVDIHYMEYGTVGGMGEATNATGAIMVPQGQTSGCSGPRPIVLYAHGTSTDKAYNIADITDVSRPGASEGLLLAATYAAQGFIVVAPNYAGYDLSRLNYHPYLNAEQSAHEMVDALTAARKALPYVGGQDSGKLLLSGYSQGGHVAMATHRAMQAANMPVTASAPLSGPYATAAFGDAVFYGNVNLGATAFVPLLLTSYQKAYGTLYSKTTDVFEPAYAAHAEAVLPSFTSFAALVQQGQLPLTALFSSTPPSPELASITPPTQPPELAPLFALGFGSNHLINNATRLAYLQDAAAHPDGAAPRVSTVFAAATPQHPIRQALKANDLRNWRPQRPMLLCGGNADPTVFYAVNTGIMQAIWSQPASPLATASGVVTVLDVDSASNTANDPFAAIKAGFAQAKAHTAAQGGTTAVVQSYHGTLVPPFCNVAARGFFQQVLASGS